MKPDASDAERRASERERAMREVAREDVVGKQEAIRTCNRFELPASIRGVFYVQKGQW